MEIFTDEDRERWTLRLGDYLPPGRAFGAKTLSGSATRLLLQGLGVEPWRAEMLLADFENDIPGKLPSGAIVGLVHNIAEWESALGIPDDCFGGDGTDDERRRDIMTKLASLGVQTAADMVALAEVFGLDILVQAGNMDQADTDWHELVVPGDFATIKIARFSIVVTFLAGQLAREGFLAVDSGWKFKAADGDWPLAGIRFSDQSTGIVECLLEKLKPANCQLVFLYP